MSSKKTFFLFCQNFRPSSLADAVRLTAVVEYLNSKGHKVFLLTQTKEAKQLESDLLEVKTLRWVKPTNTDKNIIRLIKEVILGIEVFVKLLVQKNKNYYFFTSPPFVSVVIGIAATIFKKGSVILDIRDIYPDIYVKQKVISENGFLHNLLKKIEKFIYKRSAVVLAATQGLLDCIKERTNTKVLLFRNGFSNFFTISETKKPKFTVVFHGTLSKFQNVELLVDIVKGVNVLKPEIDFYVIGSGPKEILFQDMPANFKFFGRKSNEETALIIRECNLGISLRDDSQISKDAFPVKLYEYIGVGIPSIATPICEGGLVLSSLDIGFNVPNDKNEIISLILELYSNKYLYERMKTNVALNRSDFSRAKISDDVLRQII